MFDNDPRYDRSAQAAAGCDPAQHHAHPRRQFARGKGFYDIIIGAHFKADNPISFFAARGQQDNRQIPVRADVARQAQPVFARHHDVENGEINRISGEPRARRLCIGCLRDAKALLGQKLGQRLADRALVIDQQQMWNRLHRSI